jgi:drug/metabolite transporter (DMT)-like permease
MTVDRDRPTGSQRIPLTTRWGVGLAVIAALISGVSIFVNGFAVKQLPDPAVYTTLKNGVAALLLLGVALLVVRRSEVRALDRRSWAGMALIGVIGGSIPFLLFFSGLAAASAPTAAFIQKTLFVWVALLAVPLLGERLGWFPIVALGVLLTGLTLVAPPVGLTWGPGETMIAAATLFWAIEVIVARRLMLRDVPSPVLAAARLGIGLIVLIGYLAVSGRLGIVAGLNATQWLWALGTGVLLAAYVGTWLAALRRAPASIVASVLVLGAPITAVIQSLANGVVPAPPVLAGQALITVAVAVAAALAVRAARREASVAS